MDIQNIRLNYRLRPGADRQDIDWKTKPVTIFLQIKSEARGYSTIAIKKAFNRAGIENFKVHDLRHTAASRLAQNGCILQEIGYMLGHASTAMSERYSHLLHHPTKDKVVNVLNQYGKN